MMNFIEVWIDATRHIPALSIAVFPEITRILLSSIPISVYLSMLLSLSYSVRRKIKAPISILVLLIISMACNIAASMALKNQYQLTESYPAEAPRQSVSTLGYPGLMLTQQDITMVLLEDPAKTDGSRVVSIPGQALIYQEKPIGPGNTILPLPSAPFQRELPYFLKSIMLDFSLAARHYQNMLNQEWILFVIHTAAICLLLSSLRFIFTVSRWHLANLFLGALVFRGILTLEIFLNTDKILSLIHNFIGNWLPNQYTGPIIFTCISILVILYSFLAYLARGRLKKGE
ncbi:MAG: hypothetical protein LBV20_04075 [Treponema sp.]|nr:hypothetical protein [Treponema sp.]